LRKVSAIGVCIIGGSQVGVRTGESELFARSLSSERAFRRVASLVSIFSFDLYSFILSFQLLFTPFELTAVLFQVNLFLFQVAQLISFKAPVGPLLLHGDSQLGSLLLSFFSTAFSLSKSTTVVTLLFFQLFLELSYSPIALVGDIFKLNLQLLLAFKSFLKLPLLIISL
jgi:hypothetical protein